MDARPEARELKLKDSFKETDLYKHGVVWLNKQVPKDYQHVESLADLAKLSVKQKNYEHTILSYQLFIEPKGEHLTENDRWKEDFLKEICAEYQNKDPNRE